MSEYLAPGVYVEETSFRSKTIEGVSTTTTGFAGIARTGPIDEVRLITSFTEYESTYGGLEKLLFDGIERDNFMAHAARMFFENGGQRLYVSRVFTAKAGDAAGGAATGKDLGQGVLWRARFPGLLGNVTVTTKAIRRSLAASAASVTGAPGTVVEIVAGARPKDADPLGTLGLITVDATGKKSVVDAGGNAVAIAGSAIAVDLQVSVSSSDSTANPPQTAQLTTSGDAPRFVGRIFDQKHPENENSPVWLDLPANFKKPTSAADVLDLFKIFAAAAPSVLDGGNDGSLPTAVDLEGREADPDDASKPALGLFALGEIDDIAIVALPDASTYATEDECVAAVNAILAHVERFRYRIAVVDGPRNASINKIRDFRGRFDSTRAAIYHPWLEIFDPLDRPTQGAPPRRMVIPPSGAVCGIYARSDISRGVHKAPANEVVLGLNRFELNINKPRQEVLNPEGINALRFFEGRGQRVWGARTMSSDPEWKYVNVRRLFLFIEHSIDKATQYAVFEPNNERLWANIAQSVADFLLVQWKNGALMGTKPEEAFFVRCDRTTMTQNDIDNGRMICLVGIAPVMPAEFVIFRIGQFTLNGNN